MSYYIWIDDERPTPIYAVNNQPFNATATTTNEALKIIRRKYKEGVRNFFLDIDNDTEDALTNKHGGEFYNVLAAIDNLNYCGKFKDIQILVKIHTGNSVARQRMRNLIQNNSCFTEVI